MQPSPEFIPVTIDKSHITTIGERLYAESIEFVRELVNNAYDADATLVEIVVAEDSIEILDNGIGMDLEGLRQYFNIGSQQKLYSPKSSIYHVEGTPIKAPHFRVRINNHTVTPRSLSGHKIPFLEGTSFGPLTGEIVILSETEGEKAYAQRHHQENKIRRHGRVMRGGQLRGRRAGGFFRGDDDLYKP